jgi:hypothetical protein
MKYVFSFGAITLGLVVLYLTLSGKLDAVAVGIQSALKNASPSSTTGTAAKPASLPVPSGIGGVPVTAASLESALTLPQGLPTFTLPSWTGTTVPSAVTV